VWGRAVSAGPWVGAWDVEMCVEAGEALSQ
jgi:hypothetical protein